MTNILDRDVPETDDELDAVLDAANSPEVPTSTEPANEADGDADADHEAPEVTVTLSRREGRTSRTGNSAWVDGEVRRDFDAMLASFKEARYSRPEITEMTTQLARQLSGDPNAAGLTPAAIWRAENGKVHAGELDLWTALFGLFADEKLPPSAASLRPPKAADLKARIEALEERLNRVAEVLATEDVKTVKQYREVVDAAREIVTA